MEPLKPAESDNKKSKKFLVIDGSAYALGVIGNIAVAPQIIKAWSGPAPGMAVLTWIMFVGFGIIWLLYAIVHNQKPLIFAQIVGISCNAAVVIGWLLHHSL